MDARHGVPHRERRIASLRPLKNPVIMTTTIINKMGGASMASHYGVLSLLVDHITSF
jgi:hypothetical protein